MKMYAISGLVFSLLVVLTVWELARPPETLVEDDQMRARRDSRKRKPVPSWLVKRLKAIKRKGDQMLARRG